MKLEDKIKQRIIDHEGLRDFSLDAADESTLLSDKATHILQAAKEQKVVITLKSLLED